MRRLQLVFSSDVFWLSGEKRNSFVHVADGGRIQLVLRCEVSAIVQNKG